MKLKNKAICIGSTIALMTLGYIIFVIIEIINSDLTKNIKHVTANTKIIDANIDHNQALDVYEHANKQGVKTPNILINFDTHSDIYLNQKVIHQGGARIENWVNEFIAKNPNVEKVYWIMPKEATRSKPMMIDFWDSKENELAWGFPLCGCAHASATFQQFLTPLTIKGFEATYLIDPKTGVMNEYIKGHELNDLLFDKNIKYKKIKIITCTESSLPDFKGQDVFLSVDADYFSNSGYDTFGDFVNNKDEEGIKKAYKSMFKTLKDKHVNPTIISLTLSPQYVPKEDHKIVLDLFEEVFVLSKHQDAVKSYTRFFTGEAKKSYNKDKSKKDAQ